MILRDLRLKRFAKYVSDNGGPAALARKFPIDESYVSQLLNKHRPFGEVAARNMEKRCQLEEGFFDVIEDEGYGKNQQISEERRQLLKLAEEVPEYAVGEAFKRINDLNKLLEAARSAPAAATTADVQ